MTVDWDKIRKEFPAIKSYVFLNSASRAPMPERTINCLRTLLDDHLREEVESGHKIFPARMWEVRKLVARMLRTKAEKISLAVNTSTPLNIAAQGIPFRKGDNILLSDNEFPANVYPWLNLGKNGVKVKFLKSRNGIVTVDDFAKAWDKRTRAIAVSFVNFHNGFKNDLKALAELCHAHEGYLIVDGIQGVGVNELDVEESGVDFISAGGAKWLISPYGSGFMYVSDRLRPRLDMTFVNWLAAGVGRHGEGEYHTLLEYDVRYAENGRRFEIGTMPYYDIFAFGESQRLLLEIGIPVIEERVKSLLDPLIYELHRKGIEIASLLTPEHRSTILSFRIKNAAQLAARLMKKKIIVSYREGLIRVSPHIFNNESDISRLLSSLPIRD